MSEPPSEDDLIRRTAAYLEASGVADAGRRAAMAAVMAAIVLKQQQAADAVSRISAAFDRHLR